MAKRNWKKVRPTSLRHAIELCKDYAKDVHNLSVEKIADLMGLVDHWQVYKWMQNGRIPGNLIRPFEHACGCTYITEYIANSAHKVLIDIPGGRKATEMDINTLQSAFADASGLLIRCHRGEASPEETIEALTGVIGGLAWHRENVRHLADPELPLFQEDQ